MCRYAQSICEWVWVTTDKIFTHARTYTTEWNYIILGPNPSFTHYLCMDVHCAFSSWSNNSFPNKPQTLGKGERCKKRCNKPWNAIFSLAGHHILAYDGKHLLFVVNYEISNNWLETFFACGCVLIRNYMESILLTWAQYTLNHSDWYEHMCTCELGAAYLHNYKLISFPFVQFIGQWFFLFEKSYEFKTPHSKDQKIMAQYADEFLNSLLLFHKNYLRPRANIMCMKNGILAVRTHS